MRFTFLFCSLFLLLIFLMPSTSTAQQATDGQRDCWHDVRAAASLPGQPRPVFCDLINSGRNTAQPSPGRWLDEFNHGVSTASFSQTNYKVYEAINGAFDSAHWRHANHWMVDIAPNARNAWNRPSGGALLQPNAVFWQLNNQIVVEADYAAGHQAYSNLSGWGELIVSSAPTFSEARSGGAYGYEMFPGHYTLGCRLQADRHAICSLMDKSDRSALNGGRLWEISFFQQAGKTNEGGLPTAESDPYWRVCRQNSDPDTVCRDRFRMEITRSSVTLYVNGYKYFSQTGLPSIPAEFFNSGFYVYYASIVGGDPKYPVVRFHWDRLAVNPYNRQATASETFVAPPAKSTQTRAIGDDCSVVLCH